MIANVAGCGVRPYQRAGTIVAFFALIALIAFIGCTRKDRQPEVSSCRRIVSLSPSITETIFALGAEERLVGVTDYCKYPPAAQNLSRVGGYVDLRYEAILSAQPDHVFLLREHTQAIEFLKSNRINFTMIENSTIADILSSIEVVGTRCHVRGKADSLVAQIQAALAVSTNITHRPRVLICIGRKGLGSGTITQVFLAGLSSFYNEILESAGGVNVYQADSTEYPVVSAEGIIRLAPEIIIDLMASMSEEKARSIREDWHQLDRIPAVRNGRIYCLTGSYLTIPGPRIAMILKDFRRIINAGATGKGKPHG